ncbi:MAG: GGDEF domain-containing protein [Chloroflexota bacterium]
MEWRHLHLEPTLGSLEPAYRKHVLPFDVAQIRLVVFIMNVLSVFLIRSDYGFFGPSRLFFALVLVRLALLFFSGVFLVQLHRLDSPRTLDGWITALTLFGILGAQFIQWTRPYDYLGYVPVSSLALFCLYLVLPIQLKVRLALVGFYTLFDFINLSLRAPLNTTEWRSVALTLVVANLMGLFISVLLHANRRFNYLLLQKERTANQKLHELAMIDPLTLVKNRRMFLEQGEAEIDRCRRHGSPLSLALIDLDQFKQVNDTLGHHAGDEVLGHFARLMDGNTRGQDLFARLGGDEFGLLMPGTDPSEAGRILSRLVQLCQAADFQVLGQRMPIRMSVGLTHDQGQHSLDALMRQADQALYAAKRAGGDQAVWQDGRTHVPG